MSLATPTELEQLRDATRDPTVTDGDKYKVIAETDRVRVLDYRDAPGQRTSPHRHPDFVLVALSAFRRRLTMADGREVEREFLPGQVATAPAQSHIGENIGSTETHVLIIELK